MGQKTKDFFITLFGIIFMLIAAAWFAFVLFLATS
jgi:hypothetical protein